MALSTPASMAPTRRRDLRTVAPTVAPLLALVLMLSGCAPEPTPGSPADPDASPAAEAEADADADAEKRMPSPDECLVGSWQIDNDAYAAFMSSFDADMGDEDLPPGVSIDVDVSGARYMRFDDEGTYYSWSDDFTYSFGGGAVTHVSNSAHVGDYGVILAFEGISDLDDSGVLWLDETLTVMHDEVLTVGGIAQFSDEGESTTAAEIFGLWEGDLPNVGEREKVEGLGPFTCSGDLLTLVYAKDSGMPLHRTEVTYE